MIFIQGVVFLYDLIDIHNHCLYCVDDGASSQETMENMISIAYNDGIKVICFTPHFKLYKFRSDDEISSYNDIVNRHFQKAVEFAHLNFPDMTLFLGNEIMYHNDISDSISSASCRKIGSGAYVLVEFSPHVSEFDLKNGLLRLSRKGYKPILAHFERYACLLKKPSLLSELKSSGIVLQANASSVLKFSLGKTAKIVKYALKRKLVGVICTDAHNDTSLSPVLSKAHAKVLKKYGESYAKKIFHSKQCEILNLSLSQ